MTLGLGVIVTWPATIVIGCIMAGRRHRGYQAWFLRRLRTPNGTWLAGHPPWPEPMPALQASAARTAARSDLLSDDA